MSPQKFHCHHHHSQSTHFFLPLPLLFLLPLLPTPISSSTLKTAPPLPLLPVPTSSQLQWQLGEMALFLHFGMNTFTNTEWGTGHADPTLFNPSALDAKQWVRAAAENGFSRVVLTAKHHDGFCLWPSAYTNYSVEVSNWWGGVGDVVGDVAVAAKELGIEMGLYLSPWDRHDASYNDTVEYNEFYLGQMAELLTSYGEIKEVFLDGAPGKLKTNTDYLFQCWFDFIHQLQPGAVIFSDSGPDSRWIGNEAGIAGSTCWSLFNRSLDMIGNTTDQYSSGGDPVGHSWVPAECDVSIRPGWFWHSDEHPKSAIELLETYYTSVGRNCLLMLNVPPNSSGLISDEDLHVLRDFAEIRETIFSNNLAQDALISASSTHGGETNPSFGPAHILHKGINTYWAPERNQSFWEIHLDLQKLVSFNVLQIQEPVQMGQRVSKFHLAAMIGGEWSSIANGTTIGYKRLLRFPLVETQHLNFIIDESRADPLISYFAIHLDEFSLMPHASDGQKTKTSQNESQVIQQLTQNYQKQLAD